MSINLLDAGLGLVLLLFVVRGLIQGMVKELTGLVGVVLGFFLSKSHYTRALPMVQKTISDPDYAIWVSYAFVFASTLVVVAMMGHLLRKFMVLTFTAGFDHVLGGVVGACKGGLLCVVALTVLSKFAPNSPFLTTSELAKHTKEIVEFARILLPNFL